ncbi:MAG: 30S ribosomal protein S5 [Candidatus Blackburnbacteria bacterium]|nr:30S ribosomal protein S5 [Candidatus Blackburnbacteria bacterium]
MNSNFGENQARDYQETVIEVRRVSKKTKGGNQIRFSVLVVVGDRKGKVGLGVGKAPDVVSAIRKAIVYAKKRMVTVPLRGTTIPYEIRVKHGAAKILLKPVTSGSGIIAGGPLRAVIEASGIRDIVAKMLGSNNKMANVYAAIEAFRQLGQLADKKEVKNENSRAS